MKSALKSAKHRSVAMVCEKLNNEYRQPDLGNPLDPLDDLIFILLSNRATSAVAHTVFSQLKQKFPTWNSLRLAKEVELQEMLQPCGLQAKRAASIMGILNRLFADTGCCDLNFLRSLSRTSVLQYLISLPGVSNKVARCVMIYTLDHDALPVDAHVFRIAKRLGWTSKNRPDLAHTELEALVPLQAQRAFHINAVMHGRLVCRERNPSCAVCCIASLCSSQHSLLS